MEYWEQFSRGVAPTLHAFLNDHPNKDDRYACTNDLTRVNRDELPNKCYRLHYTLMAALQKVPVTYVGPLCQLWEEMTFNNRYLLSQYVRALAEVKAEHDDAEIYHTDITKKAVYSIDDKDFEKKVYFAAMVIQKDDVNNVLNQAYMNQCLRQLFHRNDGTWHRMECEKDITRIPAIAGGDDIYTKPQLLLAHLLSIEALVKSDHRMDQPIPDNFDVAKMCGSRSTPSADTALITFDDPFVESEEV